jgi:AraC-like DNA-binding protein
MSDASAVAAAGAERRETSLADPRLRVGQTELVGLRVPPDGKPARRSLASGEQTIEVLIPLAATVVVRPDTRDEHVVRPGDALYLLRSRSYAAYSTRGASAIVLELPRSAVGEYIEPATPAAVLVQNSAVLTPARAFFRSLLETGLDLNRLSSYFVEKLVWEMVASVFLEGRGVGSVEVPNTGLLSRAITQIAAYRTDRSLTPEAVAASLNISMRQLQRVFAATGSTPSREIRRQRMELAVSMLESEAYAVLNVSQIAHHSGFADAAELRRALVSFGYPNPRELRTAPRSS